MNSDYKVLVDTSVLVSASINQLVIKLKCELKHHFYEISKPLFDYLDKNIDKRIGIFTPEIESSAKDVLIRAIDSEIKDTDKDAQEKLKEIDTYSYILEQSTSNLAKNMSILVREPIYEKAINKITYRVFNFYTNLKRKLEEKNPDKIIKQMV